MQKCLNLNIFRIISGIVTKNNTPAFVIGGYVRNLLLNKPTKDIDIVVVGNGIDLANEVAREIGNDAKVNIFKNFGTAMLRHENLEIEFVGARKESYRKNSRKPIVENGTLEDDQKRRDFTINTLAISLNKDSLGELIDPFSGITDLKNKIIKTPLDPLATFSDDPLRMIRAIRFASQLNFTIEPDTLESIKKNIHRISIVSQERIIEELHKIILSHKPSMGFRLLECTGLLAIIFPDLQNLKGIDIKEDKGHKDNFDHTLKVLDNVSKKSDNLWLRWTALLHDIGKPKTKKFHTESGWTFHGHDFYGAKIIPDIFKNLKLPLNEKMKYVQKLVLLHLRPIVLSQEEVTDSAIRRLLFDAGDDIDDLMNLCEADITSKNKNTIQKHLQNFQFVREKLKEIEKKDSIRNFQPPVSGGEIMKTFGLSPSKEIGIIKNAIKDAILDGIIQNDFKEAYSFMISKGKELGLIPWENKNE